MRCTVLTAALAALLLLAACGSDDPAAPADEPAPTPVLASPPEDVFLADEVPLEFSAPGARSLRWLVDRVELGSTAGDSYTGTLQADAVGGGAHLLQVQAVTRTDTATVERWFHVTPSQAPFSGDAAPGFFGADLQGNPIAPDSLRAGHVTLINFWASWCPPCLEEMPALQTAYDEFAPQGLRMLAVNTEASRERCDTAVADLALTFPVVHDSTQTISRWYYTVGVLPTSYVVDGEGVIQATFFGAQNLATFREVIAPLLADR